MKVLQPPNCNLPRVLIIGLQAIEEWKNEIEQWFLSSVLSCKSACTIRPSQQ